MRNGFGRCSEQQKQKLQGHWRDWPDCKPFFSKRTVIHGSSIMEQSVIVKHHRSSALVQSHPHCFIAAGKRKSHFAMLQSMRQVGVSNEISHCAVFPRSISCLLFRLLSCCWQCHENGFPKDGDLGISINWLLGGLGVVTGLPNWDLRIISVLRNLQYFWFLQCRRIFRRVFQAFLSSLLCFPCHWSIYRSIDRSIKVGVAQTNPEGTCCTKKWISRKYLFIINAQVRV